MRPRTKKQVEVVKLSGQLPPLSAYARKWAIDKVAYHFAKRTNKETVCFDCGEKFDKGGLCVEEEVVCPKCGRKLFILRGNYKKRDSDQLFNIITTIGGYQVVRVFEIEAEYRLGVAPKYSIDEVVQKWIDKKGCVTTLAANITMQGNSFYKGGKLSLKTRKHYLYDYFGAIYPIKRVLPIIKRNGFKGNFHNINPVSFFSLILTSSKAETLLKVGQFNVVKDYCSKSYMRKLIFDFWAQLKICIRNNYYISDTNTYFDNISLLDQLGYDIHNSKFICPSDLTAQHIKLIAERDKHLEEKEAIRVRAENEKYQREFVKEKAKLLNFEVSKGELKIKPLKSVKEFYEEGKALHHCVYQCGYYKREDSFILSARKGSERLETIEVNLDDFTVVQSRGLCNKDSKYHTEIVKLVKSNLNKIKSLCS